MLYPRVFISKLCYIQVKEQGSQKGETSPFLAELLRLEGQAKQQGVGRWTQVIFFPSFLLSFCSMVNLKCCFLLLGYNNLTSCKDPLVLNN